MKIKRNKNGDFFENGICLTCGSKAELAPGIQWYCTNSDCPTNHVFEKEEYMTKKRKQPDPTMHLVLSIIKSIFRLLCAGILISMLSPALFLAGVFLGIAEIIGIVEELV